MPVLPPTEESTCASRRGRHLHEVARRAAAIAAAKPARSPTTPPPSASTRSPPLDARGEECVTAPGGACRSSWTPSPGGTVTMRGQPEPPAARRLDGCERCRSATLSSVTMAIRGRRGAAGRCARRAVRARPAADQDIVGPRAEADPHVVDGCAAAACRRRVMPVLRPRRPHRDGAPSASSTSSTMRVVRLLARLHGRSPPAHRRGSARPCSRRSVASGSRSSAAGGRRGLRTRRISTSRSAFSQTETPVLRRSRARVSAFMKAPPPVASTSGALSSRRAMTRRSPSRKSGSP